MQAHDFYKLGRPVQDRLIGCLNGTGLPAPTLAVRGGPVEPYVWLLGGSACAVGLVLLYRFGLGALDTPVAIQSPSFLGGYAVLLAAIAFALLRAGALLYDMRALPFKPGIYLFPIGVIDARRFSLKIYSIDDLISSQGPSPSHGFKLTFKGGGTFEFRAKNAEIAAEAAKSIAGSRGQVEAAEDAPGSMRPRALAALDPLQGFVNPLAPTSSIERTVPPWARFGWAIAPAIGIALGGCLWLVRNVVSDDRMFDRAKLQDTAEGYRAYLARGARHRGEIEVVLLPRAELREAEQKGTVDAIEDYIQAHPKTGIASEIDGALKEAMLAELEEAKKVGTVTALRDFATRHPTHHLEPELKAATHAVYTAAFDHWKQTEAPKDPATSVFVEKLVAWAEQKGPKVDLRFHRRAFHSLERAEASIGKNRYFMGTMSFPAHYVDAAHLKPHEDDMAKAIVARFNGAFPKDVLEMSVGTPVDDPDGTLPPTVAVPTWFIDYVIDWDGGLHTSDRPRGVFVGLGFTFETLFRLPDDAKPLKFKPQEFWRAPHLDGLSPDEHPEEQIYMEMTKGAFDAFEKRITSTVFAAKS